MIPIKKEPNYLYQLFRSYENCKFCRKGTDTWHEKTNTPVCKECAKTHKEGELKAWVAFARKLLEAGI